MPHSFKRELAVELHSVDLGRLYHFSVPSEEHFVKHYSFGCIRSWLWDTTGSSSLCHHASLVNGLAGVAGRGFRSAGRGLRSCGACLLVVVRAQELRCWLG